VQARAGGCSLVFPKRCVAGHHFPPFYENGLLFIIVSRSARALFGSGVLPGRPAGTAPRARVANNCRKRGSHN